MKTDLFTIDHDVELLKKRRRWYITALVLFLLSIATRQPLAFLAALFTLLIGIVPELWYRNALRHLVVRQQVGQQHVFFGEEAILSMSIENQKLLPLPWLQVENKVTPSLTFLGKRTSRIREMSQDTLLNTWLLWSFQRVTRHYRMRCQSRGLYTFGPVRLWSSDPFGWLECEAFVAAGETLLVYPLIAPLEALGLSAIRPFGEHATQRRLLEDPLRVAGVRDYVLGDDPRRIHWKATAHIGALRSKVYEPSSLRRLLVLLDIWNYSDAVKGVDLDIQELTITVAASLASWALDEGYMVGLLANSAITTASGAHRVTGQSDRQLDFGDTENAVRLSLQSSDISSPVVRVPFALDHGQYERILSMLARLVPRYSTTMERLIDTEDAMFPFGTTIILVSAVTSLSDATIERLLDLRIRGSAVHLALMGDPDLQTLPETYDLPVYYPGGKEKWHELTRAVGDGKNETVGTSSTPLQLD